LGQARTAHLRLSCDVRAWPNAVGPASTRTLGLRQHGLAQRAQCWHPLLAKLQGEPHLKQPSLRNTRAPRHRLRHFFTGIAAVFVAAIACAGEVATGVNPALFTSYNHVNGGQQISWVTCGTAVSGNSGCFGSGQIGPFGNACAVTSIGDKIIVVDANRFVSGTGAYTASVHVYNQVVSSSPSVTYQKSLDLPLPPSTTARCWAATLGAQVYVGTSESPAYFSVNIVNGIVSSGQICGTPTTGIFSRGEYLVVDQGSCLAYFSKSGMQFSGGTSGTTFFPSSGASVPLQ
jgi:hypothetical protein